MWGRGRGSPSPSRGTGFSGNYNPTYPLTLGFNQYRQPQRVPQGGYWDQQGGYAYEQPNNKLKIERLRRPQGSSSKDLLNSNYSANSAGSRGAYLPERSGITNAAIRNLPPRPPSSNDRGRDRMPSRTDSNRSEDRGSYHNKENRTQSKGRLVSEAESQYKMYFCPKCGENYSYRPTQNRYIGKVPLILHCSHTMCQECIYQNLRNNKVSCPTCQTDSILTQEETPVCQTDMQNVFPLNHYIYGVISSYKSLGGYLGGLDNMKFVSTSTASKKAPVDVVNPSDICCFATCKKLATMYCRRCEGIYCVDCCTVLHKSSKKLMTHEPVLRRTEKFSMLLEHCVDHAPMQIEFFCKTCDLTACCYCVLDKHTDHERVSLYHLNETEMEEFKKLKRNAERVLREVLHMQRKAARLANFNTGSIQKDVNQYFADYHARLETLEKKILNELDNFKSNNRGLDGVQSSLTKSAEQLKQLVAFKEDEIGDTKLNLRGALDKLRDINNIPRFLLNESGSSEPVRFVINKAAIKAFDDSFMIEKCEDSEYRLVGEEELPESYNLDLDDSDSVVDGNISAILSQSNQSEDLLQSLGKINELPMRVSTSAANSETSKKVQKHTKPGERDKRKLEMQRVDVQHINSMDCFYIRYKNTHSQLVHLNKEIEDYVKMGGAQPVDQPQLRKHEFYLAHYVSESHNRKERRWCRARLIDIKTSETGTLYEMFFIDYGMTQTVDGTRIKDCPSFLSQHRSFAIECMLHNPMSVNWNKKAHVSLAKILNGKDIYMIVKSINGGVHEVDLMIASSDGGITSVIDILVHAHQSVEPKSDDNASGSLSLRREGFCPILRVFPNSKKFAKHQQEKVSIANVVDPHHIFVQLVKYQEAFKNMTNSIKKSYKSAKATPCIPIEGTYVLAEYKDAVRSNWHRAFVKTIDLNSDKVHVLLVDWGLNVVVPTSSIRALQECFTRLECQAVLVKLAHIAPYNAQSTWSPSASVFLQGFHQAQDVLKMLVQDVDNGELCVALFDTSSNVHICVNTIMVENNFADSTGSMSKKLEWPQFETTNATFSEEDVGLVASMVKKIGEEASINEDSEEDDCATLKKRQIDVVNVDAPDLIYVKFLEFRERESAMFKELQIHYSDESKRPAQKSRWAVEERCVVEVHHEYARGKVREEVDGDYKVYLYDKAKEVTVPLDKMYVYDLYFMKYPQAVCKSHLANIRPAGDSAKWSKSSIEVLQEIFAKHKRIFASKAAESDMELSRTSLPLDIWYAHIIHGGPLEPDRMKYVSINNCLVKLGFAYKIPRPDMPRASPLLASTSAGLTASPVPSGNSGEYLLKVLTGEIELSTEEKPLLEQEKDVDSSSAVTNEGNQRKEAESTEEAIPKNPRKNKNKNKSLKGHIIDKTPVMKTLQGRTGPPRRTQENIEHKTDGQPSEPLATETEREDAENIIKDKEDDQKGEVTKNWNTIVEEELGEHSRIGEAPNSGDGDEGSPYHKTEIQIDDWLPSMRLTKKDFQARVTCVETCGHLYLHEEAMDDVYYKMEANIKEYFDKNPPDVSDHKWEAGQLCTIKYTDGNWYRGRILKVKTPTQISVIMIDFGSDHDLSPNVLFREVLYTDIGSFATKVKLDKVYTKSGSWISSDYDHFHQLVTDWCRVVVKGPVDVELPLVDIYNEHDVFVNQKLVELCPNLSRCSSFPIAQGVDEEDIVFIECIESEAVIADEVMNMLLDNFDKEMDKKIPKTLAREASSSQDTNVNLTYKKLPLSDDLQEGKKVLLEIGGVISYDKIVLKMPGNSVSEEIYDLIIDLQDAVDSLPLLKDLVVGMPCLTPYSEDGVWYRARITGTQSVELGFVDVLFVDYGNSESVSMDRVRQITTEYMTLPQQTWEAALNIGLNEDADVVSVMQVVKTIENKRRYFKVVKDDPLTVDVYDIDEDKLVYKNLIESGLVRPTL